MVKLEDPALFQPIKTYFIPVTLNAMWQTSIGQDPRAGQVLPL